MRAEHSARLLCTVVLACVPSAGWAQERPEPLLAAGHAQGHIRRVVKREFRDVRGFGELKQLSDRIVRGRVVDESVRLSPDGLTIWTDYQVEVVEDLTGRGSDVAPGARLTARVEGGNLVLEGVSVSVANEFFPPLPWVREHVFFLYRDPEVEGGYRFRGGPMGVYRYDDGKLRCHLPREHWGWLCTQQEGSSWERMVDYVRRTGRR